VGHVQGARHVMLLEPLNDKLPPRPQIDRPQPVAPSKGVRR
jgi:rod shape-determining protein MreC